MGVSGGLRMHLLGLFFGCRIEPSRWDCRALVRGGLRVQVLSSIASHLADMHEAGYVHGNLKPPNILWLPRQAAWRAVDFAHACCVGTAAPPAVHTLAYAAPETVAPFQRGEQRMAATTAADAWAVGVMAFELLYGGPALRVAEQGRAMVRCHSALHPGGIVLSGIQQIVLTNLE